MAYTIDFYVDPSASTDGDGSLATPYNTWSGKTLTANTTWAQKCGTTYAGKLTVTNAGVSLVTYGTGGKPKVNASGFDRCIAIGNVVGVTIDGYELTGVDTGATRRAISYTGSGHRILNCKIHDLTATTSDVDGIAGVGDDVLISDNDIYNIPSDGIWVQGRTTIRRNRIWNVATDGRLTGDCIQVFGDVTTGCGGSVIEYNYLDHTSVACKQGIIVQDTGTGSGCRIIGNTILGPADANFSPILVQVPHASVIGNRTEGGAFGIIAEGGRTGGYGSGANCFVSGNVVEGAQNTGVFQATTCTGMQILNNTIVDCPNGIYADTDTTLVAKNNIITGCTVGMSQENGATENYNCFYGNTTNKSTLGGGAVSLGAQSITSDPLLDASYRIGTDSPCYGAGTYIAGARDFSGRKLKRSPDIGAHQYYAPHGAVSPSRVGVAVSRSGVSTKRNAVLNRSSRG